MKTAEDRLRFLVEFASLELAECRPGDWLNLKDDLRDFFGGGRGGATLEALGGALVTPLQAPLPQDYTEDDFRALQQDVRQLLDGLVGARDRSISGGSKFIPMQVKFSVLPLDSLGYPGHNALNVTGSTRDCLLWMFAHLLAQEPTGRIGRCQGCDIIFYRERANQDYCGKRCVNRTNKRHWRAQRRQPASAVP